MQIKRRITIIIGLLMAISLFTNCAAMKPTGTQKTMQINTNTPVPSRFVVRGTSLIDLKQGDKPLFFHGMGYSPYLAKETPLYGDNPANDDRYAAHLPLMEDLGVNYLHVFPRLMPPKFFEAMDRTDMVYGQDVWIWAWENDLLSPEYQAKTLKDIKEVIDHTYKTGRPDRLVLFSIGDELQPTAITNTNNRHPDIKDYHGKHLILTNRTPSEVAIAKLIDEAMDYELTRYGQRHLYCHTSWTHVGPVADRPDLDVEPQHVFLPDMGDLICLNIYTYANGVRTSPKGSVTGTTYQGYLEQLAREMNLPILITQVGLSTSPINPKPWVPGWGGHKVADVPKAFRSVWKDLHTAEGREKYCGLVFFELNDEWWKSGEDETDFNQHEPDPEEWFGIYEVGKDNELVPKGDIPATIKALFTSPLPGGDK
ncbi:MAG: hypothetical protein PVI90_09420 [Desulfobacteraceae bacterium]|jgi:hypothetical protein